MKNSKNNTNKPTRKVQRIINTFSFIWITILTAVVVYLRATTDIFSPLLYMGMFILFWPGMILFQKILEKSSLKDDLEELEREYEQEEENKPAASEKPNFGTLALIAAFAGIYAISEIAKSISLMLENHSQGLEIQTYLPQCIDALTLIICCIFIGVIVFNVAKKRVFDRRNSICIYGVGATVILGTMLQNHLSGNTAFQDSNAIVYYSLLGIFIIFFGKLFDIAVQMKKEQDLTI